MAEIAMCGSWACWTSNHEAVSKAAGRDVRSQRTSTRIPSSWREAMRIGFTGILMFAGSCREQNPPLGWDTTAIARDVNADLRKFEHLTSDLSNVKVLAWRRDGRPNTLRFPPSAPIGPPTLSDKVDVVLLWGRLVPADDGLGWTLLQAFRNPADEGSTWRRSVFFRDWKVPPRELRPGETSDGTWHAFQRYAHAPTSDEICGFANVYFLPAPPFDWVTLDVGIRKSTWRRVAGDAPRCEPQR